MSDENEHDDEGEKTMRDIEFMAGMISMAKGAREFYDGLLEQEFSETDAMKLTCALVAGMMGGHRSS